MTSGAEHRPDDPTVTGVAFPEVGGHRSTTATGQAVFAAAARAVDPALADTIAAAGTWHHDYLAQVRGLVEAEARRPEQAAKVPEVGLAAVHDAFEFVRGGEATSLDAALDRDDGAPLDSVEVTGAESPGRSELAVPYGDRVLVGDDLRRQLDGWVDAGTVEPSFAAAIRAVIEHPDWLDLSGETVAVLGAGAEMGPLPSLCGWGATVLPVDVPSERVWRRVLDAVHAGRGRALVPVRSAPSDPTDLGALARAAGADLTTALPEVARWLDEAAGDGPLTVGQYVYADGADHVRVSMAVDALIARLAAGRPQDLRLGLLLTPTDAYAVPEEIAAASRATYGDRSGGLVPRAACALTGGRSYAPNYPDLIDAEDGQKLGIADCLIAQQGPNYALAKRIQRWRARAARAQGIRVSANVAPATRTRSVTKNRILKAAYQGAPKFGVEVFEPATSNTLMAALLVHDLRNDGSTANPATPLAHPLHLLADAAAHGGMWRIPFAPRSVLPLAAVRGLLGLGG